MDPFGGLRADFGQQGGEADKGGDVGRVGGEAQLRGEVLDVGLLEEAHAAGNLVINVQAGQLHLKIHRLIVGAVEDGDIRQVAAFVHEALDPLDNEAGLSPRIHDWDEVGALAGGLDRAQFLRESEPGGLRAEHGIGEVEDLGRAAVVRLDLVNLRAGVTLFEAHDIVKVGTAPGIDALRVVAHRHHLVVSGQLVDDVGLQAVRVLKLVD